MAETSQLHAQVPHDLKRRAFIRFAEEEVRFSVWLRSQLELWLQQAPQAEAQRVAAEEEGRTLASCTTAQ